MNLTEAEAWLAEMGQEHLFREFKTEEERKVIVSQLERADETYPGGIKNCCERARKLLAESRRGSNPFEGCRLAKPSTITLDVGTEDFYVMEKIGLDQIGSLAFVLVAGGLGERLGYPGIKVGLPTQILTGMTYLEWYISGILSMEKRARAKSGDENLILPLAIMTSGDTHELTMELLKKNGNFGMVEEQLTIMQQEKVPAMYDNDARIAFKHLEQCSVKSECKGCVKCCVIEMKPHGHGLVHTLVYQKGLAHTWLNKMKKKFAFFFQDTNALAFRSLAAFLGTSVANDYAMNSLCIPRLPRDNIGGICSLIDSHGAMTTVNVEYNQLDGLLKASGCQGDVAAPNSKFSEYPGNCNVLLLRLKEYAEILDESKGAVPEFVNPKYTDSTKTAFKSPTRLECMMQDFARNFVQSSKGNSSSSVDRSESTTAHHGKVGATTFEPWFCFSTVKNNIRDARLKLEAGASPESAYTAEAQFYDNTVRCLGLAAEKAGVRFNAAEPTPRTFAGITCPLGPLVFVHPSFGLSITEMTEAIQRHQIQSISLVQDSALSIQQNACFQQCKDLQCTLFSTISDKGLTQTDRFYFEPIDTEDTSIPACYRIRGYKPHKL